jgi:hypothetical protein
VAVVVLALVGVGFVAASAPAAVANVIETVAGSATGQTTIVLGSPTTQRNEGSYTSRSQLGSGHYTFVSTVSACDVPADTQSFSGTATLVRSDGATLHGTMHGSETCLRQTDLSIAVEVTLSSGTRDLFGAGFVFNGTVSNLALTPGGEQGTESFSITGRLIATERVGWWMLGTSGNVYAFGGAPYLGNAATDAVSSSTHLASTPSRNGYWIVNDHGQVYAFGDAHWLGNADRRTWANPLGVINENVVGIESTATGNGYWLFTAKGRVVRFGDAVHYGDAYPGGLGGRIVAGVATPSRHGYYLVGSDGGVFAYGDATFRGSTGNRRINSPIIGMAVSPAGDGYWLVASDGGVFAFGARFAGSLGGSSLLRPIVGGAALGTGYVLVDDGGAAFNFSNRPFFGSVPPGALTTSIVGISAIG